MVTVYVDGENKTTQLSDWTLHDHHGELQLTCHFPSGKSFTRPFSKCRIEPTNLATGTLLIRNGQPSAQLIDHAEIIGNKYALIYYPNSARCYVMKTDDVQILQATSLKNEKIFTYFRTVAQQRAHHARPDKRPVVENILRQLEDIVPHPDTALEAYCNGKMQTMCTR